MRRLALRELAEFAAANGNARDGDAESQSLTLWVREKGASAAAYLVWQVRRALVRDGYADFKLPKKALAPPWLRVALEALREREQWSVEELSAKTYPGMRAWRVRWLGRKGGRCAS